ncbi:MAG: hypothetical protein GXP47_01850 [Acidobacteria bacterium]|nr:hypothetical protein [Acidobacteriota bacterium]
MNGPKTARVLTLLLAALFPVGMTVAGNQAFANFQIVSYLPRDPLVAWASNAGSGAERLDDLLAVLRRFLPAEDAAKVDAAMAQADQKLGVDLRDDLLARLGPQVAISVDLPPIDSAAAALMGGSPEAVSSLLGRIGIWVQVREPQRLDAALRTALGNLGFELSKSAGLTKAVAPAAEEERPEAPRKPKRAFYYRIQKGVLAVGFDAERVRAMVTPPSPENRLAAGADFRRVFANLDGAPTSLVYVNLPRLQEMLRSSEMVKGILAARPEAAQAQSFLLDPNNATTGFGITKTFTSNGVRQVSFGPRWLSGGAATAGLIAAIAIPNLLNAVNRSRVRQTTADLRSLAAAIEAYRADENRLPGPRRRWVEVGTLAGDLVPKYMEKLPAADGWDHPILYWTDGAGYRLVSPGKDGATSRDWAQPGKPQRVTSFDGDLVISDGELVSSPDFGKKE